MGRRTWVRIDAGIEVEDFFAVGKSGVFAVGGEGNDGDEVATTTRLCGVLLLVFLLILLLIFLFLLLLILLVLLRCSR